MQTYTHTRGKPLFSVTSYKKLRESAWNLWKPEDRVLVAVTVN